MRKKIILDDYEKEIEESLSRGKLVSAPSFSETKKMFQEAAKNYKELRETKSITLRVNKEDLIKIKAKAKKSTIPYQTLINLLIRQYLRGQAALVL